MWLLGRLAPDYKSIAAFRRMPLEAVNEAGAELVRFARSVGLLGGEWVAIDGSKFLAASSTRSVRERESMRKYLDAVEAAEKRQEVIIDPSAVSAALKNKPHPIASPRAQKKTPRSHYRNTAFLSISLPIS